MPPVFARLHPSLRTGFLAWFLSQAFIWAAAGLLSGESMLGLASGWSHSGPPLWSLMTHGLSVNPLGLEATYWLVGLQQMGLFASCVLVYRLTRLQQLPQTAERATWVWAFNPLAVWMFPASPIAFGIALALGGIFAVARKHVIFGSVMFGLSLGMVPELLLLWPGLLWMVFTRQKVGVSSRASAVFIPMAGFSSSVGAAVFLAGDYGISLRTLDWGASWREMSAGWLSLGLESESLWSQLDAVLVGEIVFGGMLVSMFVICLKESRHLYRGAAAQLVPVLIWPFLFSHLLSTSYILLGAFPAYVLIGRMTNNRSIERLYYITSSLLIVVALSYGI